VTYLVSERVDEGSYRRCEIATEYAIVLVDCGVAGRGAEGPVRAGVASAGAIPDGSD
jgi:hypothetical protein